MSSVPSSRADAREIADTAEWTASRLLRRLVIGAGLCWSAAFIVVALAYQLQIYADGAMFSYAVATEDVWSFHWHNISGRLTVFLLTLYPAETYVGIFSDPAGGIVLYGFLFYVAPLLSLIATYAIDRAHDRAIFVAACCSTALLCPLTFGFPTEMWIAHAFFWPALAASHYARLNAGGVALILALTLALLLTHEGAVVLVFAILTTLAARGVRDPRFLRVVAIVAVTFTAEIAVKLAFPPDDYYSPVLLRAALHFFDAAIFETQILIVLAASLTGYAVLVFLLTQFNVRRAWLYAAAAIALALAYYWSAANPPLHATERYYQRTLVLILAPLIGLFAALYATGAEGQLAPPLARLTQKLAAFSRRADPRLFISALAIVALIHAVETVRFVRVWTQYKAAVATLATSSASDPSLGSRRFVSSAHISTDLRRVSWFSTTPFLSVIGARFSPQRLVINPRGNYFWLSCETATANAHAARVVPVAARELVRVYSCLHRQ